MDMFCLSVVAVLLRHRQAVAFLWYFYIAIYIFTLMGATLRLLDDAGRPKEVNDWGGAAILLLSTQPVEHLGAMAKHTMGTSSITVIPVRHTNICFTQELNQLW